MIIVVTSTDAPVDVLIRYVIDNLDYCVSGAKSDQSAMKCTKNTQSSAMTISAGSFGRTFLSRQG